ncbi:hypothetical protein PR202_ga20968 [Eleusine coracana subsp. coracana]|uniref:Uncharacterized protein n=1 Tax=Eleusine coracana subsp. coracana TaxID=191504 RepID=A0AAV5CZM3_ELECO|nr:hypothetical protein QOZ80_8AG0630850 [Eleusine coracana subsp. coracana]GJN03513.1 hypothetical protein PR202_ga20968 [Eleusine coracana subsp. coracana]
MGNCQAAEAACVVIQHPGGKVERLYAPSTAGDVMRGNPGHYVALVVLRVSSISAATAKQQDPAIAAVAGKGGGATRITKVKLLKAKDNLLFGQVYRLITSHDVAKAIQARRQEKTRSCDETVDDRRHPGHASAAGGQEQGRQQLTDEPSAPERKRLEKDRHHRSGGGSGRGRHWQPSLKSISEFPS